MVYDALQQAALDFAAGEGWVKSAPSPAPASPVTVGALLFSDDFQSFDAKKWAIGEPWDAAPGVSTGPDSYMPLPNSQVSAAGTLKIKATKSGAKVNSAFVTSRPTPTNPGFSFTHGYIESRVLLPSAAGLWASFWLLGNGTGAQGWPICGEIDIFEVLQAVSPGVPFRTDHWAGPGGLSDHRQHTVGDSPGQAYPSAIPNYSTQWTTFGLLRTSTQVVTYINGKQMFVTTPTTKNASGQTPGDVVFNGPMHIRFDLTAGKWSDHAPSVASGVFEIDYVRVWSV